MANTYTQILYHIVFSTKERTPCVTAPRRNDLYAYMWGIVKELDCHLYRIGGVDDHVHVLTHLHPKTALSTYVEKLKTGSTNWVRRECIVAHWPGWQDGYGAFTLSFKEKDGVIEYIKNQEEHHKSVSFIEEYKQLLTDAGVEFDERYLV
ncbi:MAG TPA: IS200/IS605 family transposase [Planctomycetota bacterium]|nr:IS200/IS605 family transposase [Planctomycetota bacterium]